MVSVAAEEVALWLVVGFKRSWLLRHVLDACGLVVETKEDAAAMHDRYPFLPALFWSYVGRSSTPVRALISAEWPRLHAFLDRNANNPEKLKQAPRQIVKLKCLDITRHSVSADDRKAWTKTKRDLRIKEAGLSAARDQRKSHGRSAWNVCKG